MCSEPGQQVHEVVTGDGFVLDLVVWILLHEAVQVLLHQGRLIVPAEGQPCSSTCPRSTATSLAWPKPAAPTEPSGSAATGVGRPRPPTASPGRSSSASTGSSNQASSSSRADSPSRTARSTVGAACASIISGTSDPSAQSLPILRVSYGRPLRAARLTETDRPAQPPSSSGGGRRGSARARRHRARGGLPPAGGAPERWESGRPGTAHGRTGPCGPARLARPRPAPGCR